MVPGGQGAEVGSGVQPSTGHILVCEVVWAPGVHPVWSVIVTCGRTGTQEPSPPHLSPGGLLAQPTTIAVLPMSPACSSQMFMPAVNPTDDRDCPFACSAGTPSSS